MSATRKYQSRQNFVIQQGATFLVTMLWSQPQFVVKPIIGVSQSCRAVVHCPGHGIPSVQPWPMFIRGVKGMTGINHKAEDLDNLEEDRSYLATFVDIDHVSLDFDTVDSTGYQSGGEIAYHPPVDLTGCTARMQIRKGPKDPTLLLSLTSLAETPNGSVLRIAGLSGSIEVEISALDTAGFTFEDAIYDIEILHADGETVTRLAEGTLKLSKEVTKVP